MIVLAMFREHYNRIQINNKIGKQYKNKMRSSTRKRKHKKRNKRKFEAEKNTMTEQNNLIKIFKSTNDQAE